MRNDVEIGYCLIEENEKMNEYVSWFNWSWRGREKRKMTLF